MVNFTILAGGYSSFVATYLFNSDASSLILQSQSTTGTSPSWIQLHPTNSSILYAVNEINPGIVQSFSVLSDGRLAGPVDQVNTGGNGPVFIAPLSTGELAMPNYGDGTAIIIPTTTDPLHFSKSATPITFPPPSATVSHPHMTYQYQSEVLVPDLGGDKIWRLNKSESSGAWAIQGFIAQPAGSGPRHIAIYNSELYTLHELSSTLTVQAVPPAPNGTSTILGNVNIEPPNPPAGAVFAGGEILIPEPTTDFPNAYIYVSNRNTGTTDPKGDSIAIYERVAGATNNALSLIAQVYTGLNQIRGMEFGPASNGGEAYLIASGVVGTGGVVVFQRTDGGRGLKEVARNTDVATRTTFAWV